MKIVSRTFLAVALAFTACAVRASAQQATAAPAPDSPIGKPSEVVTAALDTVARAGSSVDLNKWKGSGQSKQEVDANLASIQKDLQTTLPGLLRTADAAPLSISASLPVLLNMDALYSVLLRVSISGKMDAPRDQSQAIDGALASLDGARRDMGERINKLATSNEKQLAVAQQMLQQQAAALAQAQQAAQAAPATPVKTTAKKKKSATAAKKPAPAASTQQ